MRCHRCVPKVLLLLYMKMIIGLKIFILIEIETQAALTGKT